MIHWKKCVRRYPFFGRVERILDGKLEVFNETLGPMISVLSIDKGDGLRKRDTILYATLEGKIVDFVPEKKVYWGRSRPNDAKEYKSLRQGYFKKLSWREFAVVVSGFQISPPLRETWKQQLAKFKGQIQEPMEMDEDPCLFTEICAHQLRNALQDGGYEAFKELAETIRCSVRIRNSYSIVRDAVKKLIPRCSWEEIDQLRRLKDCDFVSFRVQKAFQWICDPEGTDPQAALEVFSKEQRLDFVLNWHIPSSQIEDLIGQYRPVALARRLKEIALNRRVLTPAIQSLLREELEAGRISKEVIAARIRLFHPDLDEIEALLSREDAVCLFLKEHHFEPLWQRLDILDESHISAVLEGKSLALDLESDGKSIRQLGWCIGKEEQEADEKDLEADLEKLAQQMASAKLIVGHNILDWDAEILAKHGCEIPKEKPVWDTLLVSFLLEPWKATHALGGPHDALGDAKKCRKLFLEQASRIGFRQVANLIRNHQKTKSLGNFYRELCKALPEWNLPLDRLEETGVGRIAVPDAWIREFQWRPNIAVGRSDGFLDYGLEEELLRQDEPHAVVLGEIVRRAGKARLVLHKDMLPVWLREHKSVEAFIGASMSSGPRDTAELRVLPFSDLDHNEVLLDGLDEIRTARKEEHPFLIVLGPSWEDNDKLKDSVNVLAKPDPFSEHIGKVKSWRVWRRRNLNVSVKPLPQHDSLDYCIVRWEAACLWPDSCDVQGYWVETIERFLSVAAHCKDVPILFVDADGRHNYSGERRIDLVSMLEDALASIGRTIEARTHHSRLRRLQIASQENKALVAPVSQLHEWLALAADAGIAIAPVIESLPLEEWRLLDRDEKNEGASQTNEADKADEDGAEEEQEDGGNEKPKDEDPEPVSCGKPMEAKRVRFDPREAIQLAKAHLDPWLREIAGPAGADVELTLIDPRVQIAPPERLLRKQISALDAADSKRIREALQRLKTIEYQEPEADIEALRKFVAENFFPESGDERKFEDFFDYQKAPIDRILRRPPKLSLLVRLPTGGGKSLIFQSPALYRGGSTKRLTLVISPLKALMQDQVEDLWRRGFEEQVEYLSSDRPWWEQQRVLQGVLDHSVLMLYVAPERLRSRAFMNVLKRRMECDGGLEYLVFDEVHCISQWGHNFRPDYLYAARKVAKLREQYEFPVLLFSATVPEASRKEICRALGLEESRLELIPRDQASPIKAEIHIQPEQVEGTVLAYKAEDWELEPRIERIAGAIRKVDKGSAAIVFVQRRLHAEIVAGRLQEVFGEDRVDYFHAGLHASERDNVYQHYKDTAESLDVLVATKAFGMGMDIPHIHHCVHLSPPAYLDDYLQEVGRIGRDEKLWRGKKQLESLIIYSEDDFEHMRNLAERSRLRFEEVDAFWKVIKSEAKDCAGEQILLLPTHGTPELPAFFQEGSVSTRSTKVRLALHWLEWCERVVIHQLLPSLLEARVDPNKLERIAEDQEEKPELRSVAEALSRLPGQSAPPVEAASSGSASTCAGAPEQETDEPKGFIESILDAAVSFLGFIFGGSKERPAPQQPQGVSATARSTPDLRENRQENAVINLRELAQRIRMSEDKALEAVREIARRHPDALTIASKVHCAAGKLVKDKKIKYQGGEEILRWLQEHWIEGLNELQKLHKKELNWEAVSLDWDSERLAAGAKGNAKKAEDAIRARQQNGLLKLMRLAGGRIEHVLGKNGGKVEKRVRFPNFERHKDQCAAVVDLAAKIWQRIGPEIVDFASKKDAKDVPIDLSTFLELRDSKGRPCRIRQITQAMDLLACLGLAQTRAQLLPMAYLIQLRETATPLPKQRLTAELEKVHELSRLRCHAMHAFCLASEESREEFISGYFQQECPNSLRKFLMDFLDQEGRKEGVDRNKAENIVKLRDLIDPELTRKQFDDFFSKHRGRKEQWEIIARPKDEHILVNAGPGSGKTAVLIARIVYLIREQHFHPWEIMVLAFNRAVVHEIRQRVKVVFEKVGYGPYVRRLRVSTFHALAAKHVNRDESFDSKKLLEQFARQLDEGMAREIAGNVRTILVDEFQDMNDARWKILTKLQKANDAHIFAIGDDDQDIVAWDRPGNKGCEKYFEDFKKCFGPKVLHLTTNFRSAEEIVCQSQAMIGKLVPNREKKGIKLTSFRKDAGKVTRETNCAEAHVLDILERELRKAKGAKESIAILCRTNAEVAEWYEKLKKAFPELKVQGGANYPLAWLRHVAVWLDILGSDDNRPKRLDDKVFRRKVFQQWLNEDIPESREAKEKQGRSEFHQQLHKLWRWCLEDNPRAKAEDLVEFVNDLTTDDYGRMDEQRSLESKGFHAVISTVHKVKGLEFDRVVILPSQAPFPFPDPSKEDPEREAMVEAKTYYVAMTRAKNRLVYFVGDREKKWRKKDRYDGLQLGKGILDGAPSNVFIAWSGQDDALQDWIFKEVSVKSSVVINVRCNTDYHVANLLFNGKKVGQLSKNESRKFDPGIYKGFKVAAVLRYPQLKDMKYFRENPDKFQKLSQKVRDRKWLWLVCVQGFYKRC